MDCIKKEILQKDMEYQTDIKKVKMENIKLNQELDQVKSQLKDALIELDRIKESKKQIKQLL